MHRDDFYDSKPVATSLKPLFGNSFILSKDQKLVFCRQPPQASTPPQKSSRQHQEASAVFYTLKASHIPNYSKILRHQIKQFYPTLLLSMPQRFIKVYTHNFLSSFFKTRRFARLSGNRRWKKTSKFHS